MRRHLKAAVAVALFSTAIGLPSSLEARQGGAEGGDAHAPTSPHGIDARSHAPPPGQSPDFFFSRPSVSIVVRAGGFLPRAEGQFFDFAFDRFTLDRSDFRSFNGGVDLGVWVSDRFEIFGSLDLASTTQRSEYRDWVEETDQGELPIQQSTQLRQGPAVTAGLKFYPTARGESVSQFIWIPDRVSPYLSGGLGGTGWKVEQAGDWVVEEGANAGAIFTDRFVSDGFSFISFLGAGVDITLRPRMALNLDSRVVMGRGDMDQDFIQFTRPLDLSGLRVSAGLSFRF